MNEIKADVVRLLVEEVVEFQEDQFVIWCGKLLQREKDAKGERTKLDKELVTLNGGKRTSHYET